jgi:xanthine/uracil permease
MLEIKDILSILGNVINGLSGMIMGLSFGFLSAPTALGYCAGIIGMLAFKTVIPINIQGETIVLAGTVGKNFRERISIVFFSGVIMVALGALGLLQRIVDFAGPSIISAMEAGVGIIVIRVAIDLIKANKKTGMVSLITAFLVYFISKDLNWTLISSMLASIIFFLLQNKGPMEEVQEDGKFKFFKPVTNLNVIRGALALTCLSIGTNIAYSGIVAGMAKVDNPNVDGLTIYSGAADILTGLFGGTPVEITLSSTAAAPHPIAAGILLMIAMALILFARLVPKMARYIPSASISGFLFVLGSMVSVPLSASASFNGADTANTLAAGATMAVTALVDPFIGLIAGLLIRSLSILFGIAA